MRSEDSGSLSLDSFFDILTNVVGVMVLIALLTVLSTGDISVQLGTPVLHAPPPDAKPLHIECRKGQLFFVEAEDALDEFWTTVKEWAEREERMPRMSDLEAIVASRRFGTEVYRLRADDRSLYIEPEPWVEGLSLRQIGDEDGEYIQRLRSLARGERYLYFLVREDSFGIFRRARGIARRLGLSTGWVPLAKDELLRVGNGRHEVQ